MGVAHVASALLVALAALLLYPEVVRDQLRHLPLQFLRDLAPNSHDNSPTNPTTSNPIADAPLDFDALRDYVDANSHDLLRWGTYRSGLYYGVRSRTYPYYVAAGLLWGSQHEDISQLRHECRQEDRLQKYGWLQHDGRSYGSQSIEDQFNRVQLRTHYVRLQGDGDRQVADGWASRFEVSHLEPRDERLRKKQVSTTKLSLFFYMDLGCEDESLGHPCRQVLKNLIDVAADPVTFKCKGEGDDDATCTQMTLESEGIDSGGDDDSSTASPTAGVPLQFKVQLQLKAKKSIKHTELRFSGLKDTNVLNVKERLQALAERVPGTDDDEVSLDNIIEDGSTFMVVQAIIETDTTKFETGDVAFDVIFSDESNLESTRPAPSPQQQPIDALVSSKINELSRAFDANFEAKFQLSTKELALPGQSEGAASTTTFNQSHIAFARAAFSNLMGGIGFFYGSSLVQHDPASPQIQESKPKPLFTAVPSRSFFPRGFLWDEGFHQIGISVFDEAIARDVIAYWLGLMEDDGYIAREQILGQSARRRVPSEFIVQHVEHANPPTLLLCIEKMLLKADFEPNSANEELQKFVRLIFPFLEKWYQWLLRTQQGPVAEPDVATFRWRGRKVNDGKLISNTLSSGLDDYPRASLPSENEMHVDLLSWMVRMSDVMGKLSKFIALDGSKTQEFLSNKARFLEGLDRFHWNEELQSFFDVGDHSEDGRIERHVAIRCRNDANGEIVDATSSIEELKSQRPNCPATHPHYLFPLGDGKGGLKMQQIFIPGTTTLQHVKHVGYVSIFPLLLKVLPANSPKLRALLDQIADPQHLWSPFGLRSMSTRDLFYERENAPGDNPYWRGSIWMNINYLALDALHHYAQPATKSPFQKDFQAVYEHLRANVISTIFSEYERTGYLWEQYSGDVHGGQNYGKGQRCHPFSGWTALVVNIMAEKY